MIVLSALPIFLSSLLIAAHFYRSGSGLLAVICVLVPFLLLSKSPWIPRVIGVFLLLAAAEWMRTMYVFIEQYQAAGVSWYRLAIILSAVILFTVLSSLLFRTSAMKNRYSRKPEGLRVDILSDKKIK